MASRRLRSARRVRFVLAWALVSFAAGQAALGWYVTRVRPQIRDPEYAIILGGLKARLAREPHRPLAVLLGSSRFASSVRPSVLPPAAGPTPPLLHNCSVLASGPIRELQTFQRLLDEGIQPDYLFVEAWSLYLVQRCDWWEEAYIRVKDLRPVDWSILSYCPDLKPVLRHQLLENLLAPGYAFRQSLLEHWAPYLPQPRNASEFACWSWTDPKRRHIEDGWIDPPGEPHPPRPGSLEAGAWPLGMRAFCDPFEVHPPADCALRELLRLATERGIRTFLVLCPDPSVVRGPAGMDTWEANRAYLEEISRTYGVPVLDTRSWVPDEEFTDFAHIAKSAVEAYTRRFGRKILEPLLAGKALDPEVLLISPTSSPPAVGSAH
jgi:hypothetical protein